MALRFLFAFVVAAGLGPALLAPAAAPTEAIIATFDVSGERFRVRIENPATIEQARALERGESSATIPNGRLLRGSDGNEPWSWHLDPVNIELSEITIELCDGRPSFVEADLDYWVDTVGRYCPWNAELVGVEDVGGGEPTQVPSMTEQPTATPQPALPSTGQGAGAGGFSLMAVAGLAGIAAVAAGAFVLMQLRATRRDT